MAKNNPKSVVYVVFRASQLLLSAGHMFVCGSLIFYFDADDLKGIGYAPWKREPRRGGGSSHVSGSSKSSSSTTDPVVPPAILLAAGTLSLLTAISSLSTQCCVLRRKAKAMRFFFKWDMFLFFLWLVGIILLAQLMGNYDVFNSTRPYADWYKVTLGLSIVLLLSFLWTTIHAWRLKKKWTLAASTLAVPMTATAPAQNTGYIPVPSQEVKYQPVPQQYIAPSPQLQPGQPFQQGPQFQQQQQFVPQGQQYGMVQQYQSTPSPVSPSPYAPPPPQQYPQQQQQFQAPAYIPQQVQQAANQPWQQQQQY
ncbi:hypothetical protein FN846DRAFT_932597 [Sphaerosporella brunnea]|uniref:Uncharacterized protein n=1 Tax=Sphaerosporella brunnea TaxID=1250544 RepID=A0A5J5F718_9PEZI|nr:hypothetical protein FN846DRAFT_932597 [Sphaerosporella brunnea]